RHPSDQFSATRNAAVPGGTSRSLLFWVPETATSPVAAGAPPVPAIELSPEPAPIPATHSTPAGSARYRGTACSFRQIVSRSPRYVAVHPTGSSSRGRLTACVTPISPSAAGSVVYPVSLHILRKPTVS